MTMKKNALSIAGLFSVAIVFCSASHAQSHDRDRSHRETAHAVQNELLGGHDKSQSSHKRESREYRTGKGRAYLNQWDRADYNYDRHTGSYNRNYNPDANHQRAQKHSYDRSKYKRRSHTSSRRSRHHDSNYNRGYDNYGYNDYRYRNTNTYGHSNYGNDHRYYSRHSGSRYHIGGHYRHSNSSIVIGNYGRYGLHSPPRGHHWVRDRDNGDAILASVATGAIIGLVVGILASDLDDHNDHYNRRRRY